MFSSLQAHCRTNVRENVNVDSNVYVSNCQSRFYCGSMVIVVLSGYVTMYIYFLYFILDTGQNLNTTQRQGQPLWDCINRYIVVSLFINNCTKQHLNIITKSQYFILIYLRYLTWLGSFETLLSKFYIKIIRNHFEQSRGGW